jgi:hypothetical protein
MIPNGLGEERRKFDFCRKNRKRIWFIGLMLSKTNFDALNIHVGMKNLLSPVEG